MTLPGLARIVPERCLLLVVDAQERLLPAMAEPSRERLVTSTELLLDAAAQLGVAVSATEQYPKGLGPTVPSLRSRLEGQRAVIHPKLTFDACLEPSFLEALEALAPRAIVVCGMEAHVCVFQTVRSLAARGHTTYVVADAVASRREEHKVVGLRLAERAGAIVTVAETVIFDWLERAGTEAFKSLSKRLR